MHTHLEIVMPPTDDVKAAVGQILRPFQVEGIDRLASYSRYRFWDFYVIGGRYSGAKLLAMFDSERRKEFDAELQRRGVTVSGFTCGKQELDPASQIPMVDRLWVEFFPNSPIKACPLFSHYNDQYIHSDGFPDILRIEDMPQSLEAGHVIVAAFDPVDEGFEAEYMVEEFVNNGVTLFKTGWDGLVASALADHKERLKKCHPKMEERCTPKDDWLVVTVDYHS